MWLRTQADEPWFSRYLAQCEACLTTAREWQPGRGFSTATPVPAEHTVIPAFPEDEGGTVERFYHGWHVLLRSYERGRAEHSHPGFGPHAHSHVKLIAARNPEPEGR